MAGDSREHDERCEFLSSTPFFGGLSGEPLEQLVAMLHERRYPATATVIREGETGRAMYIVREGELVKYQTGESGHVVKLMRFRPGDFFGEMTLIDCCPNQFTVAAESNAVLYELTNMDLYHLYESNKDSYVMVLQNINRELCRRLRSSTERITEYADEQASSETQLKIDVSRLRRLV